MAGLEHIGHTHGYEGLIDLDECMKGFGEKTLLISSIIVNLKIKFDRNLIAY